MKLIHHVGDLSQVKALGSHILYGDDEILVNQPRTDMNVRSHFISYEMYQQQYNQYNYRHFVLLKGPTQAVGTAAVCYRHHQGNSVFS